MSNYLNDYLIDLYSKLYSCLSYDVTKQLDIYPQLESLYDYFDNCVFLDSQLEVGKTYILPVDVNVFMFDEDEYSVYTNPSNEGYDPDLAPFVESHNMHTEAGGVCITLKAGTEFIYDNTFDQSGPYAMILVVDGYSMYWYDPLIYSDAGGAVPYVIKA